MCMESRTLCLSFIALILLGVGVLVVPIILTIVLPVYSNPVIVTNRTRLPNINNWCYIKFNEGHLGWSANQPLDEWTRIFIPISYNLKMIQITPCDESGNPGNGIRSYIFEAYSAYNVLYVSLEYWGSPWRLYIGGNEGIPDNLPCNAVVFNGSPP